MSIECGRSGIVIAIRAGQEIVRAQADAFELVDFITYRSTQGGSVACGAQPEVPALLTWRPDTSGPPIAVALELLPDGFVP